MNQVAVLSTRWDQITPAQWLALFISKIYLTKNGGFYAGIVPKAK
jgi:hypothetical protein